MIEREVSSFNLGEYPFDRFDLKILKNLLEISFSEDFSNRELFLMFSSSEQIEYCCLNIGEKKGEKKGSIVAEKRKFKISKEKDNFSKWISETDMPNSFVAKFYIGKTLFTLTQKDTLILSNTTDVYFDEALVLISKVTNSKAKPVGEAGSTYSFPFDSFVPQKSIFSYFLRWSKFNLEPLFFPKEDKASTAFRTQYKLIFGKDFFDNQISMSIKEAKSSDVWYLIQNDPYLFSSTPVRFLEGEQYVEFTLKKFNYDQAVFVKNLIYDILLIFLYAYETLTDELSLITSENYGEIFMNSLRTDVRLDLFKSALERRKAIDPHLYAFEGKKETHPNYIVSTVDPEWDKQLQQFIEENPDVEIIRYPPLINGRVEIQTDKEDYFVGGDKKYKYLQFIPTKRSPKNNVYHPYVVKKSQTKHHKISGDLFDLNEMMNIFVDREEKKSSRQFIRTLKVLEAGNAMMMPKKFKLFSNQLLESKNPMRTGFGKHQSLIKSLFYAAYGRYLDDKAADKLFQELNIMQSAQEMATKPISKVFEEADSKFHFSCLVKKFKVFFVVVEYDGKNFEFQKPNAVEYFIRDETYIKSKNCLILFHTKERIYEYVDVENSPKVLQLFDMINKKYLIQSGRKHLVSVKRSILYFFPEAKSQFIDISGKLRGIVWKGIFIGCNPFSPVGLPTTDYILNSSESADKILEYFPEAKENRDGYSFEIQGHFFQVNFPRRENARGQEFIFTDCGEDEIYKYMSEKYSAETKFLEIQKEYINENLDYPKVLLKDSEFDLRVEKQLDILQKLKEDIFLEQNSQIIDNYPRKTYILETGEEFEGLPDEAIENDERLDILVNHMDYFVELKEGQLKIEHSRIISDVENFKLIKELSGEISVQQKYVYMRSPYIYRNFLIQHVEGNSYQKARNVVNFWKELSANQGFFAEIELKKDVPIIKFEDIRAAKESFVVEVDDLFFAALKI